MRRNAGILVLSLVGLVGVPPPVSGQTVTESFAELAAALAPGDSIVAIDRRGGEIAGRVLRVERSSIVLDHDGPPATLAEADVRSISRRVEPIGLIAIPIGAAIGFAIGYEIGNCHHALADCGGDTYGPAVGTLVGAPIGIGIGAALHLLTAHDKLVYAKPPTTAARHLDIDVVPVVAFRRQSVVVAIRF